MSRLKELREDLLEMDRDQLMEKIQEVREDRRISKHAVTQKKARGVKKAENLRSKMNNLSDEQKLELIKLLEAESEG
tara:strand:+ start:324 stop:554 length:231 start_codon:yes stop_codon:yes gene_type:complete